MLLPALIAFIKGEERLGEDISGPKGKEKGARVSLTTA